MVQEVMDSLKLHVNKLVHNIHYFHYKMVMDKLDNVSVIMIYPMLLDMEQLIVESQEVHGVTIFIIINSNQLAILLLDNLKTLELEHYVMVHKTMVIQLILV